MDTETPRGTKRIIDGRMRVYYEGYWIKAYETPDDTLLAKKRLIEALTRRLVNHVEHGINVPGARLDEARQAFDTEADPQRRRVKGAMLAGALFNRAADIFTKLVEIQALGVEIAPDNELMARCGDHLQEALALGRLVFHRSGEEGIDELWGEPFKAFAYPIEDFYRSRYIKIAHAMKAIDRIAEVMHRTVGALPTFAGIGPLISAFALAAKVKSETLRTEVDIFEVWTSFAVSAEALASHRPILSPCPTLEERSWAADGMDIIGCGKDLVFSIARARVPMPKSTRDWIERAERYHARSCRERSVA